MPKVSFIDMIMLWTKYGSLFSMLRKFLWNIFHIFTNACKAFDHMKSLLQCMA